MHTSKIALPETHLLDRLVDFRVREQVRHEALRVAQIVLSEARQLQRQLVRVAPDARTAAMLILRGVGIGVCYLGVACIGYMMFVF